MSVLRDLYPAGQMTTIGSAPFGADILELARHAADQNCPVMLVVADDRRADAVRSLVEFFRPALNCLSLPAWDCLPYDRISPAPAIAARRCATLGRLARYIEEKPFFLVTTSAALVQKCAPKAIMKDASIHLKPGEIVEQRDLENFLVVNGYTRVSTVRERGEYAQRGGIIDIYAPGLPDPVRLDFFGDTLESIRSFDPETQRSLKQLKKIEFSPVSEVLFTDEALTRFRTKFIESFGAPSGDPTYEAARSRIRKQGIENWLALFHSQLDTVFDYLPGNALIALDNNAMEATKERFNQAEDYYSARVDAAGDQSVAKVLAPGALYLTPDHISAGIRRFQSARFISLDVDPVSGALSLDAQMGRDFAPERVSGENVFDSVVSHIRAVRKAGRVVVLGAWTTGSADRLVNP